MSHGDVVRLEVGAAADLAHADGGLELDSKLVLGLQAIGDVDLQRDEHIFRLADPLPVQKDRADGVQTSEPQDPPGSTLGGRPSESCALDPVRAVHPLPPPISFFR